VFLDEALMNRGGVQEGSSLQGEANTKDHQGSLADAPNVQRFVMWSVM
jgi:hypothetical protein